MDGIITTKKRRVLAKERWSTRQLTLIATVSANVKARRLALGLNQRQLAQKLGISQSLVSVIDSPILTNHRLSLPSLAEWAHVLQAEPFQFLIPGYFSSEAPR